MIFSTSSFNKKFGFVSFIALALVADSLPSWGMDKDFAAFKTHIDEEVKKIVLKPLILNSPWEIAKNARKRGESARARKIYTRIKDDPTATLAAQAKACYKLGKMAFEKKDYHSGGSLYEDAYKRAIEAGSKEETAEAMDIYAKSMMTCFLINYVDPDRVDPELQQTGERIIATWEETYPKRIARVQLRLGVMKQTQAETTETNEEKFSLAIEAEKFFQKVVNSSCHLKPSIRAEALFRKGLASIDKGNCKAAQKDFQLLIKGYEEGSAHYKGTSCDIMVAAYFAMAHQYYLENPVKNYWETMAAYVKLIQIQGIESEYQEIAKKFMLDLEKPQTTEAPETKKVTFDEYVKIEIPVLVFANIQKRIRCTVAAGEYSGIATATTRNEAEKRAKQNLRASYERRPLPFPPPQEKIDSSTQQKQRTEQGVSMPSEESSPLQPGSPANVLMPFREDLPAIETKTQPNASESASHVPPLDELTTTSPMESILVSNVVEATTEVSRPQPEPLSTPLKETEKAPVHPDDKILQELDLPRKTTTATSTATQEMVNSMLKAIREEISKSPHSKVREGLNIEYGPILKRFDPLQRSWEPCKVTTFMPNGTPYVETLLIPKPLTSKERQRFLPAQPQQKGNLILGPIIAQRTGLFSRYPKGF